MIVEWILDLVEGFVTWFLGLFDSLELPEWMTTPPPEVLSFFSMMTSMGVWVPWGVLAAVLGVVLTVYAAAFLIKLIRQILAHVPMFGGSG